MARYVLSRVAIPAAAVVTEVVDLKSCKRSELPIYMPDCQKEAKIGKAPEPEHHISSLEKGVMSVRTNIQYVIDELKHYETKALKHINAGVGQVSWLVNYLGEEDNIAPKGPAIAIGGLTGFIFAVRGGIIKKIIFTTVGVLGMASICYPKESSVYIEDALSDAKQYVIIGYNFIYGVKKDDPPLELPSLPKMPGSVSEAWSMVKSFSVKTDSQTSVSDDEKYKPVKKN